jgi:hypothetical protein
MYKKNIYFQFILISSGGPLLLNGFSQPPGHRLHQLLEVVAIAHPATKVSGFFLAKAKTLLKVDLRGTLALQSSMATLFSSLEKGLLVFPHMAAINWQKRSGFLHSIGHQNGKTMARMVKFCMEHPKTQKNEMQ